jgi:hypothetical protein
MANLAGHGLEGHPAAVGEPITDQLKTFAATVFYHNQEVGVALGEVGEKGRLAGSASAWTSTPAKSTLSSSSHRARVSLPASVD